ncbi:hypothetical protein DCAR_0414488 [Daucus carota subsp. sativus]|uniref:TF-B3 domain-containing protein n=1 Tax=Daucus carota subsp. sativus TaxID=79200 RepID=A0AAF0WV27_DAUCS|nr:hypothetical protein DCAR_0414488 [Daucus carota subsp. sativus]
MDYSDHSSEEYSSDDSLYGEIDGKSTEKRSQARIKARTVPYGFHDRHGRYKHPKIKLLCTEGFKYKCRYDREEGKIVGLQRFFRDHWVTQNSIITFQWPGGRSFLVRIYKPTGIEADYNWFNPRKCQSFKDSFDINDPKYSSGGGMVEEEKAKALLMFNGKREQVGMYEMVVTESCLEKNNKTLEIKGHMQEMCEQWNSGDVIKIKFVNKVWKIEITKKEGVTFFDPGWFEFCDEAALMAGDTLVLRTCKERLELLACVLKMTELQLIEKSIGCDQTGISFLQFGHDLLINDGVMVDTVLCGGREWQVKYSKDTKMLSGLLPIMREYEVKIRDTIFFTVARDGESVVKIFRRDGTEIRYCKAVVEDGKVQEPFLQREEVSHVEVIDVSDDEAPMDIETDDHAHVVTEIMQASHVDGRSHGVDVSDDEAPMDIETDRHALVFAELMQASHVDGRSHGVYLGKSLESAARDWKSGMTVIFNKGRNSWPIGVIETNNRIRFSKGWNAFFRDNDLGVGDSVTFTLQPDVLSFEIAIKYADKKGGMKNNV